jgi:hypothetical protein
VSIASRKVWLVSRLRPTPRKLTKTINTCI